MHPTAKDRRTSEPQGPPIRVALYVRVSSVAQVIEGFSLEAQDRLCRTFAAQRGWVVVAVYTEPGVSAKDSNRPAFQQMLRDARAGRLKLILSHKLDRFSRSLLDVLIHLNQLEALGVSYVSASEPFDFTTPIGKVQLAILAAFAQWYLDNLSQEIAKGKTARARCRLAIDRSTRARSEWTPEKPGACA
ncbi:MAG: recombinase family protein [Anaerolineales bacterium]|nr:recombinase family protein [Anaerolineales bacterium]